eukprot:3050266-Pyramimonas_sp.AAC.1
MVSVRGQQGKRSAALRDLSSSLWTRLRAILHDIYRRKARGNGQRHIDQLYACILELTADIPTQVSGHLRARGDVRWE